MYSDDSGDETGSFYSGILIPLELWNLYLEKWLKFRKWAFKKHNLSPRYELHAYNFIVAREEKAEKPFLEDPTHLINTSVGLRHEICIKALLTIGAWRDAKVVTYYAPTTSKVAAYAGFLDTVDTQLRNEDAWAIMITDGSLRESNQHVQSAHRGLDIKTRRIIEDGWIQPADMSQLIQVADLIVHCAFQGRKRQQSRDFMWTWYADHMHDLEWVCEC